METILTLSSYLNTLLDIHRYQDRAINGLQVEAHNGPVKKVAVSVDAGAAVIERAVQGQADVLIVHHGLLYGDLKALTGPMARKLRLLFEGNVALYSCHLPLDGHIEFGNAAVLGRRLGLRDITPFIEYRGMTIGVKGETSSTALLTDLVRQTLSYCPTERPLSLAFGRNEIRTVAIATGAASFALETCARSGIDLFITGEPAQEAFHLAKELKINVLFAGHYATETFGVRALAQHLEEEKQIETFFIDEPTMI
jgi:dinuclear metal center YbgI/SA1388 family protein